MKKNKSNFFKSELLNRILNHGWRNTLKVYRDEYLFKNLEKNIKSNNDLINVYKSKQYKFNIFIRYENQFARKNQDHPLLKRGYQYARCRKLAYKLILKGNNVDVSGYDFNSNKFKKYDHVIACYSGVEPPIGKLSNIIIFTTAWPKFNNNAENIRVNAFNKKYNVNLKPTRNIKETKISNLEMYRDIYLVGNKWTRSTYPVELQKKIKILPSQPSFYSKDLVRENVLKQKESNKFIFFGSSCGLIHKGLDLVLGALEEFGDIDLDIQVMGKIDNEKEVVSTLREQLKHKSIRLIGWVDIGSKKFMNIFKKASFCLLPTCSEGQSESVITCMANGIIPITTKMSGVDLDEKCIEISNNISSVKNGILKGISLQKEELYIMRKNCIEYVDQLRIISQEAENDIIRNM